MNKNLPKISRKTKQFLPLVFLFAASAIWGTTFVTQRIAGEHMGAFTYNGLRFALGALSLVPIFKLFEKDFDKAKLLITLKSGIYAGLILFIASNLQQFGIVLNPNPGSASEAGFITGMYIIFVPLFGLFLRRKIRPVIWVAAVLAFLGLTLISVGPEGISSIGASAILLVLGAVFWALHIIVIDRYIKNICLLRFTAIQFAVSSILSLISAFTFETVEISGIIGGIFPLIFGGLFACGAAYTFQMLGQRKTEPSKAAIIFSLESLFAAISEFVWLGEIMTLRQYIGGGVIFIGILLSQVKLRDTPNA